MAGIGVARDGENTPSFAVSIALFVCYILVT